MTPAESGSSSTPAEAGSSLLDLVRVMDRLRSPGGCPWDARQTHSSLVEYLVEEAYETVEAIEESDRAGLREELGDLLLQVVFHARIAAEDPDDPWTIDDVADGIVAKLIARHPHVFGEATTLTPEEVEANWHAAKAREKGRESVTDGIPSALPALVHAGKVVSRSSALGDRLPPLARVDAAAAALDDVDSEEAYGELLVALVALGRDRGFDAETATRTAARRRIAEVRAAEGLA
jgi:XTP/dITP diphosphohydrolase